MNESKEVSVPLAQHFKLSLQHVPKSDKEIKEMSLVPYANAVGSVIYTLVCTRPDIAHSVSVASRYMGNPGKYHWEALKCILRYLKGSSRIRIKYQKVNGSGDDCLIEYVDSDYAANLDTGKSQTG